MTWILARTGILGELKRRGVERLFYHNVDNALAKPARGSRAAVSLGGETDSVHG